MTPRCTRTSAPIAPSPSRWKFTGRSPKSSPPGSERLATPHRARSGPSTTIDARIRSTSSTGTSVPSDVADGTPMESSWSSAHLTRHPRALSRAIMASTSEILGTLRSRCMPSASRQAAISFSTAFFAPPATDGPGERTGRVDEVAGHGRKYWPHGAGNLILGS